MNIVKTIKGYIYNGNQDDAGDVYDDSAVIVCIPKTLYISRLGMSTGKTPYCVCLITTTSNCPIIAPKRPDKPVTKPNVLADLENACSALRQCAVLARSFPVRDVTACEIF